MADTHGKLVVINDKGVERIGRLLMSKDLNDTPQVREVVLVPMREVVDVYNLTRDARELHFQESRRLAEHLLAADLTIEAVRETVTLDKQLRSMTFPELFAVIERVQQLTARPEEEPTDD